MLRNPEYVARMAAEVAGFYARTDNEEKYQELRGPNDPATFEEYVAKRMFHPAGRMSAYALQKIIDSPMMGGHLNQMRWSVVTFKNERHTLLTSDRPIIMTNGIISRGDHLALPMIPAHALRRDQQYPDREHDPHDRSGNFLIAQVNHRVASQARKYVYGCDDRQLRFVEKQARKKVAVYAA